MSLRPHTAASLGSITRPAHLHVVTSAPACASTMPQAVAPAAPSTRPGERGLLDQWREAHWTLRLRLQQIGQHRTLGDIERLYDAARHADNRLTEFYQLRAEHLARRLRAALITAGPGSPGQSTCGEFVDDEERALVGYFRALRSEDRASVLRLASRLGDDTAHPQVAITRRPTT